MIQDLLLKLVCFEYTILLNLTMRYYNISLCSGSRQFYAIKLHWEKYKYEESPMRLFNSPGVFQRIMSDQFNGLKYIRIHVDDLLIISICDLEDNMNKIKTI